MKAFTPWTFARSLAALALVGSLALAQGEPPAPPPASPEGEQAPADPAKPDAADPSDTKPDAPDAPDGEDAKPTAPEADTAEEEAALARVTARALKTAGASVVRVEAMGGLPKRFAAPKNEGEKRKGVLASRGFKQAYGPSTGLIVSADGLIMTSTFVLTRKPRHLFVTLADGRNFVAKLLGRDDSRALALLKIEAKGLPVAKATPPEFLAVGRIGFAVGYGLGGETPTAMRGIISALDRIGGKAIQSSALISPVNYGGPLVALDGTVQGLVVPLAVRGGMASVDIYDSGIGFAIPLKDVLALIPRLSKGVHLQAGFVGVVPDPTHKGEGVRIKSIAPGSPAANAKLEPGDLIVDINGQGTHTIWQLRRALGKHFAGETLHVKVVRQTRSFEVELTLTPPPSRGRPGPPGALPPGHPPAPKPEPKPPAPKPGHDDHDGHDH